MNKDRTETRLEQLYNIGLSILPEDRLSIGYENPEKHIFICFDHTDIRFYDDEKWDKAFQGAKELMATVNEPRT